jgi:phage terminase large subunit
MAHLAPQFAYVSAKAQDNPHLDPAYYQQLLSLPEEMRKAYAEGSWDIFAGQYFKQWRRDVHVCDPSRSLPACRSLTDVEDQERLAGP